MYIKKSLAISPLMIACSAIGLVAQEYPTLKATDTTNASGLSTGTITTPGGASIGKTLYVGEAIHVGGNAIIQGSLRAVSHRYLRAPSTEDYAVDQFEARNGNLAAHVYVKTTANPEWHADLFKSGDGNQRWTGLSFAWGGPLTYGGGANFQGELVSGSINTGSLRSVSYRYLRAPSTEDYAVDQFEAKNGNLAAHVYVKTTANPEWHADLFKSGDGNQRWTGLGFSWGGPLTYGGGAKITGAVQIGPKISNHESMLSVDGNITAQEVVVTLAGWADYVLEKNYDLPTLAQVEQHICEKRHLPGIPSELELMRTGLSVGEMQRMHMAKIEELTLYAIEAKHERDAMQEQVLQQATILKAQEIFLHSMQARLELLEKK